MEDFRGDSHKYQSSLLMLHIRLVCLFITQSYHSSLLTLVTCEKYILIDREECLRRTQNRFNGQDRLGRYTWMLIMQLKFYLSHIAQTPFVLYSLQALCLTILHDDIPQVRPMILLAFASMYSNGTYQGSCNTPRELWEWYITFKPQKLPLI